MTDARTESVDKRSRFSAVILSVLFALTFEKALERSVGNIAQYSDTFVVHNIFVADPIRYLLLLLQLLAFLLTLFRFYAGAYRFHSATPASTDRWGILWNLTNTTLLFVGFYVAALLVPTHGMFALFVATFHLVDLIWFGLGRPLLKGDKALERAAHYFVVFDVITITAFSAIGVSWWVSRFDTRWVQLFTSSLLIAMFFVDVILLCRQFYFEPDKWDAASNGASKCRHEPLPLSGSA